MRRVVVSPFSVSHFLCVSITFPNTLDRFSAWCYTGNILNPHPLARIDTTTVEVPELVMQSAAMEEIVGLDSDTTCQKEGKKRRTGTFAQVVGVSVELVKITCRRVCQCLRM